MECFKGRLTPLGGGSPGKHSRRPASGLLASDGYTVFPPGFCKKPEGSAGTVKPQGLPSAINSKVLAECHKLEGSAGVHKPVAGDGRSSVAQNNIFPSNFTLFYPSQSFSGDQDSVKKWCSEEQEMLENFSTERNSSEKMVSAEQEMLEDFFCQFQAVRR